MTQWQKVKVGDFLKLYRIEHRIQNNTSYKQVTISKTKGVIFRGIKQGSNIGRKRQFLIDLDTYPNTLLFTRQGIFDGSIGIAPLEVNQCIVTENMPMMSIDTTIIEIEFLKKLLISEHFIKTIKNLKVVGSAQKSIHERDFLKIEIDIPGMVIQQKICQKFNALNIEYSDLKQEITQQQILLKKLRQQILQEAIEGKLTQDWRVKNPNTEPASELLKRIQAEKQQLIKDKKIKAQKPLSVITEDEKLFKLPKSWVWCQVNDIANIGTGATPLTSEPSYYGGEFNWMTSGDTGYDYVTHTKLTISKKAIQETNCKIYPTKTLVVAMYGQGKTRGQVTELKIDTATNQACVAIQIYIFSVEANQFLKTHFKKIYNEIRKLAQGGAQPNLNMGKIKANVVALPPLLEQKAIVAKVEKLLSICDKLQTQITANQTHAVTQG
jgi:restriction endonuclease S subunit